eukprot:1158344-Pelagomonas_calceolata.AAC.21
MQTTRLPAQRMSSSQGWTPPLRHTCKLQIPGAILAIFCLTIRDPKKTLSANSKQARAHPHSKASLRFLHLRTKAHSTTPLSACIVRCPSAQSCISTKAKCTQGLQAAPL